MQRILAQFLDWNARPGEDPRSFEEYSRWFNLRVTTLVFSAIFFGTLFFGLTDHWAFVARPDLLPSFKAWRVLTTVGVFAVILAVQLEYRMRRPWTINLLGGAIVATVMATTVLFSQMGRPEDPWIWVNLGPMLFQIVLIMSPQRRLALNVVGFLGTVGLFVVLSPAYTRYPLAKSIVLSLLFFAILFHLFGLLVAGILEQHFRQRIALKDLAESLEERLQIRNKEFRELYIREQTALEEERLRIARDLHDDMAQYHTALLSKLYSLRQIQPKEKPTEEQKRRPHHLLNEIQSLMEDYRERSRAALGGLRPKELDDLGLEASLSVMAQQFQTRTDIPVEWVVAPQRLPLPKEYQPHIFRFFQEVLTNIERHAQATKVEMSALLENQMLTCAVLDNGVGFDFQSESEGFGLAGIRERVDLLGGEFELASSTGSGTHVIVRIPLSDQDTNSTTISEEKL